MAIYKPTYCEPFLSTEDFSTITASNPLYLYCKIASSNFDVTGYRIRLLGPNNEQQFPLASPPETSLSLNSISFIEDLKLLPLNPDPSNPDTNSGRNGTFLKIPFYIGAGSKASNTVSRNQINNDDLTLFNGNDYKWIITLYQLEKVTGGSGDNRYRIPTNVNYYDIILTTGVIVGSTPKRIQTMPSDKILSDYYIQPVQINGVSASGNLVSQRASSWIHSGGITPVGSRGRIYTYDNTLGHLYPQLAVEGAWENVINRTLWLAGTDGVANGIQVFKQSGNWDDLQTTQKADMMPYGAIPWTWVTTPANLGQSYGRQEYWITKDNYNNNPDTYYPFDTEKNITITSSGFTTQAQGNLGNDAQPPVCLNNNVWYTISNHTLYMTSNGGQSFSSVTFASTPMNSLVQRVFNLPYKDSNNETHNRLWVLAGSSLTDPTTPYQLYAKNVDVQSSSWVECGTVFETTDDDDENLSSAQFVFPEPIYNEETRGWNYWYGCSTQHDAYAAQQKYNIYIGRITTSVDISNAVERYEKGDYYPSDNEYYLQMPSAIRNASWGGLKGFVAAPYWGELSLSIYGGTMNLPSVTTVWNIPGDESQNYYAIPLWIFTPQTAGDPRRVVYERRPDGTETTPLPYCSLFTTSARNISTIKSYAFGGSVSVSQGVVAFNTSSLGYQLCLVGESSSGSGTSLRYILSFYDSSSLSLTQQTDVCGWGFCSLSSVVYNLSSTVYCYQNGQEFSSLSGAVHAPVYSTPLQTTSNSVVSVIVFGGVSNVFCLTTNGTDWTTKLIVQNDSNTWTGISCVYYTQQTYAFRGILTSSATTGITGSVYIDAIITGDNPAQKTFNGPPVTEKMRIILNYQPDSASFDWANNTIPAPFAGDSRYNGIYSPEFTVEFYDGALEKLKSYDEAVYVKVIVYWRRTIDADTWGELLNKIVMIDPNSIYSSDGIGNDWAGQNVQINVEPENNNGGVLNTTPFKFVAEKPIKLYELDETNNPDINKTAIIFYNNPTADAKEIIPANTLFLKPLNNLENGNIIKFTHPQYDIWGVLSNIDNIVWSANVDMKNGVNITYGSIPEGSHPENVNYNNPTYVTTFTDYPLADPSREGYIFSTWKPDAYSTIIPQGTQGDISLWARWQSKRYWLHLEPNGGSGDVVIRDVEYDERIDAQLGPLPVVSRDGYNFLGWYITFPAVGGTTFKIESNDVWVYDYGENGTAVVANAHWDIITYTIQYVLNNGEQVAGNPTTYTIEDTPITLTAPTKTGYSFTGWTWDGQDEPQTTVTIPQGATGNKTFVAHWSPITTTVQFLPQGDQEPIPEPSVASQNIEYDSAYQLPTPTRTGYVFDGWYYNGTLFPSSGIWKVAANNISLQMKWAYDPTYAITYTVTDYLQNLSDNNYVEDGTRTFSGYAGQTITYPPYSFVGFDAPTLQTTTLIPGNTYNVSYYYDRKVFVFVKTTNNGATMDDERLKYGATITSPTREGFTFGGWYTDKMLNNAVTSLVSDSYPTAQGNVVHLYAYWEGEAKTNMFDWRDEETEYSLMGVNEPSGLGAQFIRLPSYVDGLPVTGIGVSAMMNLWGNVPRTIYAPMKLETIGANAFNNSGVGAIWLPNTLSFIDEFAFVLANPTQISFTVKYQGSDFNQQVLKDPDWYRNGPTPTILNNQIYPYPNS